MSDAQQEPLSYFNPELKHASSMRWKRLLSRTYGRATIGIALCAVGGSFLDGIVLSVRSDNESPFLPLYVAVATCLALLRLVLSTSRRFMARRARPGFREPRLWRTWVVLLLLLTPTGGGFARMKWCHTHGGIVMYGPIGYGYSAFGGPCRKDVFWKHKLHLGGNLYLILDF